MLTHAEKTYGCRHLVVTLLELNKYVFSRARNSPLSNHVSSGDSSRRPDFELLKCILRTCPGSLALAIYNSVYAEWLQLQRQGESKAEIDGFLEWILVVSTF